MVRAPAALVEWEENEEHFIRNTRRVDFGLYPRGFRPVLVFSDMALIPLMLWRAACVEVSMKMATRGRSSVPWVLG